MAMDLKLKKIRERADALGVDYHHRANAKTIEAAINSRLITIQNEELGTSHPGMVELETTMNGGPPPFEEPMSAAEFNKTRQFVENKLAGSLIRVRIQNMNAQKKEWPGEFLSVGSAKLGTHKKFIPFGGGEPYHVPRIIYNVMKDKKCSQFYNVVDPRTKHKTRKSKLINEYVLEELDPLTVQELKDLALKQAMAQGKEG
jgi:hypothetical protein